MTHDLPLQIIMIIRELQSELKTSERRARYYELHSTTSTPTMLSRGTTLERQKVREIFW